MRRVVIAAFALVLGAIAGCTSSGGGTSPSPTPTPTPTRTAPSTPVSTPTTPPPRTGPLTTGPNVRPGEKPPVPDPAVKQHSELGATAFTNYYFASYTWGYATNDPYLVQQISAIQCEGCQIYIKGLIALRRTGAVLHGGAVSIRSLKRVTGSFATKSDFVFDVGLDEQPIVIEGPGASRSTAAAAVTNHHSLVYVSWVGSTWKIIEVGAR